VRQGSSATVDWSRRLRYLGDDLRWFILPFWKAPGRRLKQSIVNVSVVERKHRRKRIQGVRQWNGG
jgi:hypothetical protein